MPDQESASNSAKHFSTLFAVSAAFLIWLLSVLAAICFEYVP